MDIIIELYPPSWIEMVVEPFPAITYAAEILHMGEALMTGQLTEALGIAKRRLPASASIRLVNDIFNND
jgi:hypothetical protein